MDLFKLIGKIVVQNDEANKAISETSSKAKEASEDVKDLAESGEKSGSKFSAAMGKIGGAAVKIGKVVAVGIGAAATAVSGLVAASVKSYAEYEQLVGGVETLFKDSAGKVQEYAKNAYKTAGLSANEYMNTVTSFSASLLQSLGNDTEAAAEKADMAITDMSDNANKMGTDISMIQNAYQGFAKQNYTMLDNLKLGYGGTKEEMERLLADAQAISGVKYDISSYADVVDAIHVVQTEMGITGTTAKEASSTISGSLASMKSSWKNLLTAVADDSLPFDEYVNSFADSVATVGENLMPRIEIALNGVVKLIDKLAPIIIQKIPDVLSSLLPAVIDAATGLLNEIVSILPDLVKMLTDSALPMLLSGIVTVFNSLVSALPSLVESIASALPSLLPQLIDGLVSMIVTLCASFSDIIQPIIDHLPDIIISVVDAIMQNLPILIDGLITLTLGIVSALPEICQKLVDSLPKVIEMIVTGLLNLIPQLIKGFTGMADGVSKASKSIWKSVGYAIINVFIGIWNSIKNVFAPLGKWFSEKFKTAKENVTKAWSDVKAKFANIWNGIKGAFANVGAWFKNIFNGAKNGVVNAWSNVKAKFNSIKNGIVNAFSNIKEKLTAPFTKARDLIKGIADKIKGFFKGEISMPKIKLPHFSIKPKGWKIGDLLDGVKPKLGIDWYAKAINNPMIMKSPTVFGYNAETGSVKVGGEVPGRSEVVSGTDTLMNMIGATVESKTAAPLGRVIALLAAILDAIAGGNSDLLKALLAGQTFKVGEREFARLVREYA